MSNGLVGPVALAVRRLLEKAGLARAGQSRNRLCVAAEMLEQRLLLSDAGGEGVAYHDVTDGNQGGPYRKNDSVDIAVAKVAGPDTALHGPMCASG